MPDVSDLYNRSTTEVLHTFHGVTITVGSNPSPNSMVPRRVTALAVIKFFVLNSNQSNTLQYRKVHGDNHRCYSTCYILACLPVIAAWRGLFGQFYWFCQKYFMTLFNFGKRVAIDTISVE